ncbi:MULTISPECIES: DUF6461 domain-containing protein [Streptomyces]|uniref:DUF6461 domain-containing protein n=1 Tax=Streptomyces TaxID=1883 RepID=UPI00167C30AA|nr:MULTISPECIES: DUF6461 domain-containing protein [Streptomyces]MBK3520746.1 hypothetical protein [Streptomyces sp. MBT70]
MTTTTAADYTWFEERFPDLAEAYCFTLVRGLRPAELLDRLAGRAEPALTGAYAVVEAAFDLARASDGGRQLLAMTSVGAWTLLIEPNGYTGVTEDRALPASAGTRWVSHFVNINGLDAFLWAEDTVRRLWFEPGFPDERWGTTPDELLDAMHGAGFRFGDAEVAEDDGVAEDDDPGTDLSAPAAFALAEHLTGVAVTPELLERTTFTCGSVGTR